MPATQRSAQAGQQLDGLFLEDGEQVGVHFVQGVDVVVQIVAHGHRMGDGLIDAALQLGFLACVVDQGRME